MPFAKTQQTRGAAMAELMMTFAPDDDHGLGQLTCVAESGGFSGRGSAYFDRAQLKTEFIAQLAAFPLSDSAPPTMAGGFGSREGSRALGQCHVRIVIQPHGSRGQLLVRADLAGEFRISADADLQQAVTIRFLTDYAAVARFASDLAKVLDGESEALVLRG